MRMIDPDMIGPNVGKGSAPRSIAAALFLLSVVACTTPSTSTTGGRKGDVAAAQTANPPTAEGEGGEGDGDGVGNPDAVVTPPSADACVVSASAVQQDLDPEDSAEKPWKRSAGQKVVVYFENNGASERYWNGLKQAAEIWSRSPCIQLQAVAKCPAAASAASCVHFKQAAKSEDEDTDGEFSGDDDGPFRTGGTITVFTNLMDAATDNGALATIVHEVGHAIGLVHRLDTKDLMNAETDDNTNPNPDKIDFDNLLVIYGTKR